VQATDQSSNDFANNTIESKAKAQKELVETLKVQWKLLWSERYNDRVRAEGVSEKDYEILNVEQGTVINATRDFKVLNFKEILEKHMIEQPDRFIQPNSNVGGWNRFVKTNITTPKPHANKHNLQDASKKVVAVQAKKNRKGWLHVT
jgi:hypothetical protein